MKLALFGGLIAAAIAIDAHRRRPNWSAKTSW